MRVADAEVFAEFELAPGELAAFVLEELGSRSGECGGCL